LIFRPGWVRVALGLFLMRRLLHYLATLTPGRMVLWCYALWYAVNVWHHFDPAPRLWLTSLGLSAIIGAALILSVRTGSNGPAPLDRWQTFRLFLMPFCVSSFAALVKDAGYVLIFPPTWRENLTGLVVIVLFLALVAVLKFRHQRAEAPR
jgi:hypothetical protein